jgi:hypothetical protein
MAEFREAAAMSALGTPPPPTVVHPGEGRAANLSSICVVFKLWGEDTGAAIQLRDGSIDTNGDEEPPTCGSSATDPTASLPMKRGN